MYYLLYIDHNDDQVWETVNGEDAMHQRVYELMNAYDYEEDEIIVFNADDQL